MTDYYITSVLLLNQYILQEDCMKTVVETMKRASERTQWVWVLVVQA